MSLEDIWYDFHTGEPTEAPDFINSIHDYINLCAEEYYWYKKGMVDEDVWCCWHKGMINWYRNSFFIKKVVDNEISKNAAYYSDDFI